MTIGQLVAAEQRRLRARLTVAGTAFAAALVAAIAAFAGLALGGARWLALPRPLPWLVWLVALGTVALVAWRARRAARHDASLGRVAAAIEAERALRPGQVRGALEVAETNALGALAAEQVARQLGTSRDDVLAPSLQRQASRQAAMAGAGAAAAFVAVAASIAFARDGFAALLHPTAAWQGTLLPPLQFTGLPHSLVRGERLRVQVAAPGRRHVRVSHRVTGRPWTVAEVAVTRAGHATVDLGPLDADVTLTATDGRASTDSAHVGIAERAFVGDVTVRAQYPAYLGRTDETLPNGAVVRVPRGTALALSGRASTTLSEVTLSAPNALVPLQATGHTFAGRLVAESSARWSWSAIGAGGPVADVPAPLDVDVIPDSLPRVEILAPASDSTVDGLGPVRLALAASDDHGLAHVALRVWRERAAGGREAPTETRVAGPQAMWAGEATIELAARSLSPGDKLHVQAVAADASPWRQAAASRELVLRVPSTTELRASARAAADSAVARATAAAQAQKDLQQRTGDAARSREGTRSADASSSSASAGGDKSMSFGAAEKAKSLAQEQRQLGNRVQSLQEQAKSLERQLKQAGALDSSLAAQLADVQRLLRDALTPEMAQQLQSLEQNANRLSSSDSRQALEQLAAQQRALRQQLEKSVEMLRRAALEGSMQTLRDEAKDLADAQTKEAQRLADRREQTPNAAPPNGTPPNAQADANAKRDSASGAGREMSAAEERERARELAERSRELTRQVEELTKRLQNEKADAGAQRASEAKRHADASADAMERAARQNGEQQRGEQQRGEQQRGEQQRGERQNGDAQRGQRQAGEQAGARQQNAPRQGGQQPNGQPQQGGQQRGQQNGLQQQGGQQQNGQQQGGQEQRSQQGGQQGGQQQGQQGGQQNNAGASRSAQEAADEMQRAADQLSAARKEQIDAWKNELSGELDQAIQEVMQMAREQADVEKQARSGGDPSSMRNAQGAVQQGVEQTAQRLDQAGKKSSLLSQRAQRAVNDARQEVSEATQSLQQQAGQPNAGGDQSGRTANAMKEAGEALNRAAAALVRDRERVNGAESASGFSEMIAQMKELAKQQGQINAQASAMPLPTPGQPGGGGQQAARQLARQQRGVADKLEELGDGDPSGRSDALAKEARQLAQQLERQEMDPRTAQRQQQLYRRLLDAGRTMEQDERDETGKREARSGAGVAGVAPADGASSGRAATKFQSPDWTQLRGLSADERRLVIDYFRRLNTSPNTP